MAKVRSPSGNVQAPFTDSAPQDGLPDVDVLGRFVSTSGTPLNLSPFGEGSVPGATRDSSGQLVTDTGDPLFEYVDLEQTILAGLLRDGRTLIHEGVPMKAVRTIDTLLGERLPEGTYGTANS